MSKLASQISSPEFRLPDPLLPLSSYSVCSVVPLSNVARINAIEDGTTEQEEPRNKRNHGTRGTTEQEEHEEQEEQEEQEGIAAEFPATLARMKHSSEFLEIVEDAKSRIKELSVSETRERINSGATLIDVREDNEYEASHAAGARHMARGIIERDIVQTFPEKDTELILYCGGGYRSALSADMLQKMGYTNVWSMAGGWKAWEDAGAPVE